LNILSVHNRYIYRGGEDQSRELENALLRSHGQSVFEYIADNHDIDDQALVGVGLRSVWNSRTYSDIRKEIQGNRIHIVKIDNFFPQISPAVFYASRAERVPTVLALRNFRLLCAGATFFRNGRVCEDCLGKAVPWPGILHGCYRGSQIVTIGPALMASVHRVVGTWERRVTAYIAMSMFSREKFIEGGLPKEKIFVKPNFVTDSGIGASNGEYALFVGRLSPEKGIDVLLSAWKKIGPRLPLKIVGIGPLEPQVREAVAVNPRIEYLGQKSLAETYALMGNAFALVFPSQWYETFGRTVAEAFAKGTPVIASNLGTMRTMISHQRTGLHFDSGDPDSLAEQVEWLLAHPDEWREMRVAARQEYEKSYTPERNYEMLMGIYEWAARQGPSAVGRKVGFRSPAPKSGNGKLLIAKKSRDAGGIKKNVLVVGQTPPPVNGQTIMIQELLDGHYEGIALHHVRLNFSRSIDEVGSFQVRKLFVLLETVKDILIGRWRNHAQILYYPPAGPCLYPVVRDIILLIGTRWIFRYTVFHFHAAGLPEIYQRLPWWLKPLFKLAYHNADLAIFTTESTAWAGYDLAAKQVIVVPYGIQDSTPIAPCDMRDVRDGVTRILFMGILCEGKGLLTLIEACSLMQKAGRSFHLVCAGRFESESFRKEVELEIADHGLTETIEFPGELTGSEKWRAFREADVFCFPSHYHSESFGVVLIEAMSFGLPIVTTRWRGIPDVVGASGGAFIVEPKQPHLVAERLQALMGDVQLRASMGRKNRAWFCGHYTLAKYRERMEIALQGVGANLPTRYEAIQFNHQDGKLSASLSAEFSRINADERAEIDQTRRVQGQVPNQP